MIPVFLYIFYEIVLWIVALIALPKFIYSLIFLKKYRISFLKRLGIGTPTIVSDYAPIWIHAVSMGETKAVISLAKRIKKNYPSHPLIISSITETGHHEAKKNLSFADYHLFLPFDFNFIVKRVLNKTQPGLIILCETDFWFNFLRQAKKRQASIVVVNGKISERSTERFKKLALFSRHLFDLIDLFCVQNNRYQSRFLSLSLPPNKVVVTGNLKWDQDTTIMTLNEINSWRKEMGIQDNQLILAVGSTHETEEAYIFSILKKVWKTHPDLRVLIAPRHPERFDEVAGLLKQMNIKFIKFSDRHHHTGQEQVILINTMGFLQTCYQLADIALVAGSFLERVGGHNIMEPCCYAKPVIFGPYMHSQLESKELVLQAKAGRQVDFDQLQSELVELIENDHLRKEIGAWGLDLMTYLKGSTSRTFKKIEPFCVKIK